MFYGNNFSIVIAGGNKPNFDEFKFLFDSCNLCVCADSGWDYAKDYGIDVDVVLGDMDSVSKEFSSGVELIRFERDKDFSDTELCIRYLLDKGIENIFLFGGGEGRSDHFLSLFSLLGKYRCIKKWFTANEIFVPIFENKEEIFEFEISKTISIFPLSDNSIVSSDGLKWELDKFKLDKVNHSLSNETLKNKVIIKSHLGNCVVLINIKV